MNESLIALLFVVIAIVGMAVWVRRETTIIYPPNIGLLYRDGRFERELEPGRYSYIDFGRRRRIVQVSRAPMPMQLGEFTVVSKDQFSFKLGTAPIMEVTDARAFAESQPAIQPNPYAHLMPQLSAHPALHSLAASAALEVVASHGLRDLFADPRLLATEIQVRLADAIAGAKVNSVLVTSITLPPETRRMFTEVERSKIEAEAALERARGEQAALRALANAARLVKDNPALANLRFLQTLEQAPGPKTIVLGGSAVMPFTGGSEAKS
jgi:regulator of protease activity HflC (stomatin/prohibitin superfamily)